MARSVATVTPRPKNTIDYDWGRRKVSTSMRQLYEPYIRLRIFREGLQLEAVAWEEGPLLDNHDINNKAKRHGQSNSNGCTRSLVNKIEFECCINIPILSPAVTI